MKIKPIASLARAAVLCSMLVSAGSVHAALGQPPVSVESDRARLNASLRSAAQAEYAVHELELPAGGLVREFSSPQGPVFGVAWEGPRVPDLRQLLGEHFAAYVEAARQRAGRRGPLVLELPGLVVESYGHARSFHGRAYLPDLLPAGVQTDAVR